MAGELLPEGWTWSTLGDNADPNCRSVVSGPFGSNIGSRFFVEQGVPVIRGTNLTTDMTRFVDDGFVFVTEAKADELKNCDAICDDLVFTAAGTLGQVGVIPASAKFSRYIISNKQLRARLDKSRIDPLYAFYWFSSKEMVAYIQQRNTGSSVPLINLSVLRELPVPIPPLPEQRAIAHILGTLDDKIELNRRMNETLEGMARALFQSWFVDFDPVRAKAAGRDTGLPKDLADLFPDSFEDSELGEIPKGWKVGVFGDFVTQRTERVGNREAVVLSAVATGNLVRSDDHFTKRVYSKEIAKYLLVKQWDVAYNPSRINIGSVGMLEEAILGAVSPVYVVATPNAPYRWFLEFMLRLGNTKVWINGLASGSVRQSLSYRDFASIPCVIPPKTLTAEFDKIWTQFRFGIEAHTNESRTLIALRDTLLPKLLSGELRVGDAMLRVESSV